MPAPKGHPNYAKAPNLGGRPPKYSQEEIEQEAEYFFEWLQEPNHIFFKHFATERGYDAQHLARFAQQNDRFREVYKYAKSVSETRIMTYGLFKKLDTGLVKFALVNHHGYNDKQVVVSQSNPMDSLLQNIDGSSKDIVNDTEHTTTE